MSSNGVMVHLRPRMYIAKYVNVIENNGNCILVTMTFSFMIQNIYICILLKIYCGKICEFFFYLYPFSINNKNAFSKILQYWNNNYIWTPYNNFNNLQNMKLLIIQLALPCQQKEIQIKETNKTTVMTYCVKIYLNVFFCQMSQYILRY